MVPSRTTTALETMQLQTQTDTGAQRAAQGVFAAQTQKP